MSHDDDHVEAGDDEQLLPAVARGVPDPSAIDVVDPPVKPI